MSDIERRGYHRPEILVSTDWVADHLDDPDIRIVESNEDPLVYPSGHIPAPSRSTGPGISTIRFGVTTSTPRASPS